MAKRSNKIENEYRQYLKMSPEFVHLTGESLKQQIGNGLLCKQSLAPHPYQFLASLGLSAVQRELSIASTPQS